MSYYDRYYAMYMKANEQERKDSKAHWLAVHRANIKKGHENCMAFSAQILAQIMVAEADLAKTLKSA